MIPFYLPNTGLRTAYNYFFYRQRQQILEQLPERAGNKPKNSHGKCDFTKMAQTIAAKWKKIDKEELAYFKDLSQKDRERYNREMKVWRELEKAGENSSKEDPVAEQPQMQDEQDDLDDESTEPIPYTPEPAPVFSDFAKSLLPNCGNMNLSCFEPTPLLEHKESNVTMTPAFLQALEPTPLPEHFTPATMDMSRPIPTFNMQQQQQQQQEQPFSLGLPAFMPSQLQQQQSIFDWNGLGNFNNQYPNRSNIDNQGMQRLAQSLGSDGVSTLIQTFHQ